MKTISRTALWMAGLLAFTLASGPARAQEHATFEVGGYQFARPSAWEWVDPTSSMRKAQLKLKNTAGGDNAEVIFFQFPGGAGTVKDNVERWLGQFKEPREQINSKVEEQTIGGAKVTFVQAEGTYSAGMPGRPSTPMKDYALVGAIIASDTPGGGDIFVRMTGPKELAKGAAADFKKMIESGVKAGKTK